MALMSGFMNPAEFANIRQSEENFWWYRGMRASLFRMLEPHVAGRTIALSFIYLCSINLRGKLRPRFYCLFRPSVSGKQRGAKIYDQAHAHARARGESDPHIDVPGGFKLAQIAL